MIIVRCLFLWSLFLLSGGMRLEVIVVWTSSLSFSNTKNKIKFCYFQLIVNILPSSGHLQYWNQEDRKNWLTSFLFLTVCIQTTSLMGSKLNHGSLDIHRGACWRKSSYIRYKLNPMIQITDAPLVFHEFILWNYLVHCSSSQTFAIILTFLKS